MHDNWQFAVTLGTIIAGVFYNNSKIDKVIEALHDIDKRLSKIEDKKILVWQCRENSMKIPDYWQKETGPELRPAVVAYLNQQPLTSRQVKLMRLYIKQWIEADVWALDDELGELRRLADRIDSQEAVTAWLDRASNSEIDPL
jgi:hypothetical protein